MVIRADILDRVAYVGLGRVAPVELPFLGYGQSVQLVTGGADILFGFIPAVEVITGLFAGRQDACAGIKLADIERSAVDLVVVLVKVVEIDGPVPVCLDNAVAGRASGDLGDLLAVLVVPLKERLAPVSAGRIGQRDGTALNRVRRGVGAGGLAVVVYILNVVLNGRKFAVELPFLGHVQLFDLSFYANISCFLIPAAEFVTIFCIRGPQDVVGIVNRVNRVHLLFYPRTGFIREVVLDCERLLLPPGNEHDVLGADGVGFAGLVQLSGSICIGGGVGVADGVIGSLHGFPAEEGIAFAGRVFGHFNYAAGDVVVVNLFRGVVVLRHVADRLGAAFGETVEEASGVERQLTVEVVALALASVAVVAAVGGQVLQAVPIDIGRQRVEAGRFLMRGIAAVLQLALDGIEPGTSDIRHLRERRQILRRGHFADRDPLFVGVVIAAELAGLETGTCERVRVQRTSDVLLRFILDRRVLVNQLHALGINGLDEEVDRCGAPLRRQGDVLLNSSGEVILFIAQIPAVEGIAGLGRFSGGLLCEEAPFNKLIARDGLAAVGVKGDFELVDLPLCRQGDVLCDGGIKVIRGGLLLVFAQIPEGKGIALARRLDRRDSLLAALDVLLIGRRRTAVSIEGNGIFLRHMYAALLLGLPAAPVPDQRDRNELLIVSDMFQIRELLVELGHIEVGEIADVAKPVVPDLPRLVDDVVLIVLAEQAVGVRMQLRIIYDALDLNSHFKLFQLVSRRGFGLAGDVDDCADASTGLTSSRDELPARAVVLPRDVGLLLGVRVGVRGFDIRIRVERFDVLVFIKLDPVCPLAVGILPDIFVVHLDFRVSGRIRRAEIEILITRIRMLIAAVLAMDENVIGELAHRGLSGLGGGVALDFEGHFVACRDCPFAIRPAIDQREHLLEGFTLFKLMGAVSHGLAILKIRFLAILGNILVRINCDIAGIASCFVAVYSSTDRVVDPVFARPQCNANLRMRSRLCRASDIHAKFANLLDVFRRRGLGRVKLRLIRGAFGVDDGLLIYRVTIAVCCRCDAPCAVLVLEREGRGRLVCNSRVFFAAVRHNCACGVRIRIVLQFSRLDRDRAGVVYDRADIIGACNHVRFQRSVSRILCRAVNLNIRLVVDILRLRGGGRGHRRVNRYSKRYRISIPIGIYRETSIRYQPIIIEICKRYVRRASCFRRIIELKRRHICIAIETRVYKRKLAVSNYAFL